MKIFIIVIIATLVLIVYEASCVMVAIARSKPIIASTKKFESMKSEEYKILVAGDSTGFGTGSVLPGESVAGRLAKYVPTASLHNISVNGLRMAGLAKMLQALPPDERYGLILLQIGGNDILRFTSLYDLERSTGIVLSEAKKHSKNVVFMSTGDVGNAPAFGPVLSFAYHVHGQGVRQLFIQKSKIAGVTYVDLLEAHDSDPFVREPSVYYAKDGLHPSGAGYGVWFKKVQPTVPSF